MNDLPEILPIEIPERNIRMYLPLSLKTLDRRQYINFFELLYQLENKEIDYNDFSVLCIYKLLEIEKGTRKIGEQGIEDALSNIHMLADYIQAFFTRENNTLSLKLAYSENHIERVNNFVGPEKHYQNVKFGEYEDGLNIFMQYNQTPSRELLQQLMATFFRKIEGTARAPYSQPEVTAHSKNFSKASIGQLYGFYYNFAAFHTYFSSSQVYYSGQIIDLSILFESQQGEETDTYTSPFPSLGIKSTGIEIAKTGILGTLQEVRNTPLWEVALLLYDIRKKDLDERARIKQNEKPKS